ncbi:MAG TPA: choice-of-anchor tandem repeat GloVer-containing protein [Candidatus Binatia bacterium]|nr:choice-of-anchor tandem repeat GloVer-containing protein [Candidatus Binatia bacterium]
MAGLVELNGTLYGTTEAGGKNCAGSHAGKYGCGTVFSITTSGAEHSLYAFYPRVQGAFPEAGLTAVKGTLYGTTYKGGTGAGTVFSITASGTENVIYNFFGPASGGFSPEAPLVNVKGTLYGTTWGGGVKGRQDHGIAPATRSWGGTVYSITTSGTHTVLHSFKNDPDGANPKGGLINVSGTLYGTTMLGGPKSPNCADGCGVVYSITPSGVEKVLYPFTAAPDGAYPMGELVNVNGTLYGTTSVGGAHKLGTVFSVTMSGTERVLYSFAGGSDGANPHAGLVDVNGTLYGTTAYGGNTACAGGSGCGTIFSISTAGAESVVHGFAGGTDGMEPEAPLLDVNGTLYGTTEYGGRSEGDCCGTIFALTP